jgi:hypothetical protein
VTSKGSTVDLLICFQCSNVHVYLNGESEDGVGILRQPQALLDEKLKDAKIPLADPDVIRGGGGFF